MSGKGVTFSFGPKAWAQFLTVNGGSAEGEEIELKLDHTTRPPLWRLPKDLKSLPSGFYRLRDEERGHLVDACELFVMEKHGLTSLTLTWKGVGPFPWTDDPPPSDGSANTYEKETAGIVWLRHGEGRFPIGVFPRNLIGSIDFQNREAKVLSLIHI